MATLLERFSNPGIKDTLVRLATDGGNRMATFTLPTVRANLEAGRPVELGAAMVAAWASTGPSSGGGGLGPDEVPDDVHAAELTAAALDERPEAFVELEALFGDLGSDPRFLEPVLPPAGAPRRARRPRPRRPRPGALSPSSTDAAPATRWGAATCARRPRLNTSGGGFCDDSIRR